MKTDARLITCGSIFVVASLWLAPQAMGRGDSERQPSDGIRPRDSSAIEDEWALRGIAMPRRSVVLTAPFDGRLSTIEVDEGDRVEAGEIVARMDSRVQAAQAAVLQAEADRRGPLNRAKAVLAETTKRLERIRESHQQDAASRFELIDAELEYERAKADVQAAEETLRIAEARVRMEREVLAEHDIRAPFAGTVVRIETPPGASPRQGQPILKLVSTWTLRAEVHLPIGMFESMKRGADYAFEADAPVGRMLIGSLVFRDPTINAAAETVRCVFEFENRDLQWPAGFGVRLMTDGASPMRASAAGLDAEDDHPQNDAASVHPDPLQKSDTASADSGRE